MQMNKDSIRQIRNEIDRIDAELIQLLAKRFRAVKKIGYLKKRMKIKVADTERENFLQNRLEKLAVDYNLDFKFLSRLWQEILNESYRLQEESESGE